VKMTVSSMEKVKKGQLVSTPCLTPLEVWIRVSPRRFAVFFNDSPSAFKNLDPHAQKGGLFFYTKCRPPLCPPGGPGLPASLQSALSRS
jgi:hypothetical protein